MTFYRLLSISFVIVLLSLISRIDAKGSLATCQRLQCFSFRFCSGDGCSRGHNFLIVVLWVIISIFGIAVILVLLCNCIIACFVKCDDHRKKVRPKFEELLRIIAFQDYDYSLMLHFYVHFNISNWYSFMMSYRFQS